MLTATSSHKEYLHDGMKETIDSSDGALERIYIPKKAETRKNAINTGQCSTLSLPIYVFAVNNTQAQLIEYVQFTMVSKILYRHRRKESSK